CALRVGRLQREHGVERNCCTDGNHKRAATEQYRAAGESRGLFEFFHDTLLQTIISAARLTAFRMLTWGPQPHLSPQRASLISAFVGFSLSRRGAAAVMIQPLIQ